MSSTTVAIIATLKTAAATVQRRSRAAWFLRLVRHGAAWFVGQLVAIAVSIQPLDPHVSPEAQWQAWSETDRGNIGCDAL